MGLLRPSDWTADWITPELTEDTTASNPSPMLRSEFMVGGTIASARAYVTSLVLETFIVRRPPRREELIAHATAVQLHLVQAQTGDVGARRRDGAADHEFRTEHGAGIRRGRVFRELRGNPVGRPVGGAQQAHFPIGGAAPGGGAALPIPAADLPVVALPGFQRRPSIDPVNRGIGHHFAGIPQWMPLERARLRRDADFVGSLDGTPSG